MSLLVNLTGGRTLTFDLEDADSRAEWEAIPAGVISGVSILHNGTAHTVSLKETCFRSLAIYADIVQRRSGKVVGERIRIYADDVVASLLVYRNGAPPTVRYELRKNSPRKVFKPGE